MSKVETLGAPVAAKSKRGGYVRWAMIVFFIAGVTLNYITRNSLGILAPELQKELGLTTQQYSWIVAAFQTAYTIFQPICGWFIDVVGLKIGFALMGLIWSVVCIFHAGAGNWIQMAVLRFFMGATEAAAGPANCKVQTDWFPKHERPVANGWASVGFSIGAMIAPPLIVCIHLYWGWQAAFVLPGLVGLIWVVAWWKFYDVPAKSRLVSAEEREFILANQDPVKPAEKRSLWTSLMTLAKEKKFFGIAIPAFMAEPAWQALSFWVPLYLMTERGMNLKEIAMFAWLPFLFADIGGVFAGYLAPFYKKHLKLSSVNSAIATSCSGALFMLAMAAVGFVKNPIVAILLISMGGFGHQMISGMLSVLVMEKYDASQVATVNGFKGTTAWVGGCLFSLAIGVLSKTTGFTPLFVCLGFFDLIGAAFMIGILAERRTRTA